MAQNVGITPVIAPIDTPDSNDTFPTGFANKLKGGYKTVATIAERDAISLERRSAGDLVKVVETNLIYHWNGTSFDSNIKNYIGLSNVDNTSDLNKPISTATQTALDTKLSYDEYINGAIALGSYNASTNTPTLTATPDVLLHDGDYYDVTTSGTVGFSGSNFLSGTVLNIGDKLKKKGTQWYLIASSLSQYYTKTETDAKYLESGSKFTSALQSEIDRNPITTIQFGTQLDGTSNDTLDTTNWRYNELGYSTQSGTIKQVFLWATASGNIPLVVISISGSTATLVKTLGTYAVVAGLNTININQSISAGQFVAFGKGTSTAGIRFKTSGFTGNRFAQATGSTIVYGTSNSYYALGFSVEGIVSKPLDIYRTVSDSYTKSEVYAKSEVYTKTESDLKYLESGSKFTSALQSEVDRSSSVTLQFGTQLDGTSNDTLYGWKYNELGFSTQNGTVKQVFLWANGAGNIQLDVISVSGVNTTLVKTLGIYTVTNGFNTININQSISAGQFVAFGNSGTAGIRFKTSGFVGNRFAQSNLAGTTTTYGTSGSYYALGFSVEYSTSKPLDIYTTKTYVDAGLSAITPTKIQKIVRLNGTVGIDCDFSGNRGIQDAIESITDANKYKQYEILVYEGVYEATQTTDYNSAGITSGYVSFIKGKSFVSVRGINRNKVIVRGTLPTNLTSSVYQYYQTMYWHSDAGTLSNITVEGSNMRYPIHIDGGRLGCKDFISNIENVRVVHLGNSGNATVWGSYHPIGLGTSDGQKIYHKYNYIISKRCPLYAHNNANFSAPNLLKYDYCNFETLDPNYDKKAIRLESLGSSTNDVVELNNCNFGGCYIISHADSPFIPTGLTEQYVNHADFRLEGSGNSPFLYEPSIVGGQALRIVSKSSGSSSTVRFDINSSAYPLIIKNDKYSKDYTDDYNISHVGYAYKDGFSTFSGYAIGKLDVGEDAVGISSNTYVKSLGKRLGDCSTVNKTLTIIVDGVSYNIVFNKNYIGAGTSNSVPSDYTNAQIIAEITAVIGSVATVDTYAVGNDYYPEFTDVMSRNRTSEVIQKGMAVAWDNGFIRKALSTDTKIYGIALDTANTGELCRIMKKGYIRTVETYKFSTLQETYSAISKGDTLGISATAGKISKSASIKLFTAIDNNILAINC